MPDQLRFAKTRHPIRYGRSLTREPAASILSTSRNTQALTRGGGTIAQEVGDHYSIRPVTQPEFTKKLHGQSLVLGKVINSKAVTRVWPSNVIAQGAVTFREQISELKVDGLHDLTDLATDETMQQCPAIRAFVNRQAVVLVIVGRAPGGPARASAFHVLEALENSVDYGRLHRFSLQGAHAE